MRQPCVTCISRNNAYLLRAKFDQEAKLLILANFLALRNRPASEKRPAMKRSIFETKKSVRGANIRELHDPMAINQVVELSNGQARANGLSRPGAESESRQPLYTHWRYVVA